MFSEKLKKGVAWLMIVCMTICSNGFTTLANSVEDFADEEETLQGGSAKAKDYYYEYVEEREEITIMKTSTKKSSDVEEEGDASLSDESLGETFDDESSVAKSKNKKIDAADDVSESDDLKEDKENLSEKIVEDKKSISDDEEIVSPDSFDDEEEKDEAYEEEPEDDEKSSTEDAHSDDVDVKENEADENIDDNEADERDAYNASPTSKKGDKKENEADENIDDNGDKKENETDDDIKGNTEEVEDENEADDIKGNAKDEAVESETAESTEESSAAVETEESATTESIEESKEETSAAVETAESTEETTTVEDALHASLDETEGTESIDEEATDSEAEMTEDAERVAYNATPTEILEEVVEDIIATDSEMEFVDEKASESNVRIVKNYIVVKASPSIVKDGPSNWYIKKFLYDDQVGSIQDYYDTNFEVDKYLKKEIKVLVADQYGDEKVVTIPVTWDKERIDYGYGQRASKEQEFIKVTKDEAMTLDTTKTFEEQAEGKTFEEEIKENNDKIEKNDENVVSIDDDNDDEIEENDEKDDISYEEESEDEEIIGMNGTEEEPEEDKEPMVEITKVEEKDSEVIDDDYDMEVEEGGKVIYENVYVDENGEELTEEEVNEGNITEDEDKTLEKVIEGNANNDMYTQEELNVQTNVTPNMVGVVQEIASLLGTDDTISFDPSSVDMPIIILGAPTTHISHAICGGIGYDANGNPDPNGHYCSGDHFDGHPSEGARHSNQLYKTQVASTGETTSGYVDYEWQAISDERNLVRKPVPVTIESKYKPALEDPASAILTTDYQMEKNYKYLTRDIVIDKPYIMDYGSLHICLNGHKLLFIDAGALIVTGGMANEITICNCQAGEWDGAESHIDHGGIIGPDAINTNKYNTTEALGYDANYNENDHISLGSKRPLGYISMLGDGNIGLYGMSPVAGTYDPNTSGAPDLSGSARPLVFCKMGTNGGSYVSQTDEMSFIYCDGESDTRKVYMSDIAVRDVHGVYAGFGNFKNVDSFILNRGDFDGITALNGAVANVVFDGSTNKFAEVMHTTVKNCKTILPGNDSGTFTPHAYATVDDFYKANTKKGIISISSYSSVEARDGEWRLISHNDFEDNKNYIDSSVLTWDTFQGSNAVYVGHNIIKNNEFHSDNANRTLVDADSIINTWNARKQVFAPAMRFSSRGKEGTVNIYKNEIKDNKSISPSGDRFGDRIMAAGSMAFENLKNVNYNMYSYVDKGVAFVTPESGHQSIKYGGALLAQDVESLQVRNTEFKDCKAGDTSDPVALSKTYGGAIYAKRVDEIVLGYNIDQMMEGVTVVDDSMMIFDYCRAGRGGAVYVDNDMLYKYDLVTARYEDRSKVDLLNVTFKNNYAQEEGGAIYYVNSAAKAKTTTYANSGTKTTNAKKYTSGNTASTWKLSGSTNSVQGKIKDIIANSDEIIYTGVTSHGQREMHEFFFSHIKVDLDGTGPKLLPTGTYSFGYFSGGTVTDWVYFKIEPDGSCDAAYNSNYTYTSISTQLYLSPSDVTIVTSDVSAALAHGQDQINVQGTVFDGNWAYENGGAIYVDSARLDFGILRDRKGNEMVHNIVECNYYSSGYKKGAAIYADNARINVAYANDITHYPLILKDNGFGTVNPSYVGVGGVVYIKTNEADQVPPEYYGMGDSYSDGGLHTFDCNFGSTIFSGGNAYLRAGGPTSGFTYTVDGDKVIDGGAIFFENTATESWLSKSFANININKGTSVFNNKNAFYISGGALNFEYLTQGVNTNLMGKEHIVVGDDNLSAPPADARMIYDSTEPLPGRGPNVGQYVIGTDPTKDRNVLNLYGGMIIQNKLDDIKDYGNYTDGYREGIGTSHPIKRYMYEGIFGQKKVNGELDSSFNEIERRIASVYVAGNITIKYNKRKNTATGDFYDYDHNLPLQEIQKKKSEVTVPIYLEDEAKRRYVYRIREKAKVLEAGAPTDRYYRLHKNAAIGFTPMEMYVDDTGATAQVQMFGMGADASLFNSQYVDYIGQGAEIGSMVFSSGKTDVIPEDKRIIFVDSGKEMMLADPAGLLQIKFDFDDEDATGAHTRVMGDELPDQYISQGSQIAKVVQPNAVSDEDGTFKYTKDPDAADYARIFDVMGNVKFWQEQAGRVATGSEFDVWDWDLPLQYGTPPKDGNSVLYVIYALMNHSHRICGCSNDESCIHLNGEQDCAKYIGNTGEWKNENVIIQVNNVAQLMYAKKRPEYMYVLTNDIILGDSKYGRSTEGLFGDINNPINGLKLCLNGHKLIASGSNIALALSGNCYICDCGGGKNDDGTFKNTNAGSLTYKDDAEPNSEFINVAENTVNHSASLHIMSAMNSAGTDDEKIKVEGINGANVTHSFVSIASIADAEFVAENVIFRDNGTNAQPIKGSLLSLESNAYFEKVAFRNNYQDNTGMPGVGERTFVNGQGLIKLTDKVASAKAHYFKNIEFTDNHIMGEKSSLIYAKYIENTTQLSITADGVSVDPTIPEVYNKIEGNELSDLAAITIVDNNREYNVDDSSSTFTIDNTIFTHNYIKYALSDAYGACIGLHDFRGTLEVTNCRFIENGYDDNPYHEAYKLHGGAIYMGGLEDGVKSDYSQSMYGCTFDGNKAYYGGAIAIENNNIIAFSAYSEGENPDMAAMFVENDAMYGSAIYNTEIDDDPANPLYHGEKTYSGTNEYLYFIGNGHIGESYADTEGAVYIKSKTEGVHTMDTIMEGNVLAYKNKGKVSFLETDGFDASVKFGNGAALITQNEGGAVIKSYDKNGEGNGSGTSIIFNMTNDETPFNISFSTRPEYDINENIKGVKIEANTTGSTDDAIEATYKTSFEFAGTVNIKNNTNTSGQGSNFRVSTYSDIKAYGGSSMQVVKEGYDRTGTGDIAVPSSQIYFTVSDEDADMEGFETTAYPWTSEAVDCCNMVNYYHNEIFRLDEKTSDNIVIYKGVYDDNNYVMIGRKENAKLIKVMKAPGVEYTRFYAKYGDDIQLDSYPNLPNNDTEVFGSTGVYGTTYDSMSPVFGGWMYEFVDGIEQACKSDGFNSAYICARNDDSDQDVCAMFTINHMNAACGEDICDATAAHKLGGIGDTHGSMGNNTILAFRGQMLQYGKSDNGRSKYQLSDNIKVDKALVNTNKNYRLCLGGYSISRKATVSFVELNGESTGMTIHDCNTTGETRINIFSSEDASFDPTTFVPFIKINGKEITNENNRPTFAFFGRVIPLSYYHNVFNMTDNVNYAGEDGYVIAATACTINFVDAQINDRQETTRSAFHLNDVKTTLYDVKMNGGDTTLTYTGDNGYIDIEKGAHTWTNVYIEKYKISSNVGLVSMKNVANDVKFVSVNDYKSPYYKEHSNSQFRFAYINNTKVDAKGGALYLSNVKNISLDRQNDTGRGYMNFNNNAAENGYGGAIYIDDANSDTCTLNINKASFTSNKALYGGAIYVNNNTANVENAKNIINYISTMQTEDYNHDEPDANGNEAKYKGGFICFENTSGTHDQYRDEYNMKISFAAGTGYDAVINNNKTTDNTMPGSGGGFGYFEDANVYIDSEGGKTWSFENNESAEAGGVIYALHSDVKIGNVKMTSNTSQEGGSAIFIASDEKWAGSSAILDSLTLGVTGKTDIESNNDTSNQGAVYVGKYANFYLDNKVVIKGSNGSAGERSGKKNLYLSGKPFSTADDGTPSTDPNDAYEKLGIDRQLLSNFNYTSGESEIYTTVSLYDERVVNGWLTNTSHAGADPENRDIFKVDSSDTTVKVYKTGRNSNRNVHIGKLTKPIYFVLDGGTMGSSGQYTDTNKYSQNIGVGAPVEIGTNDLEAWRNSTGTDKIQRSGYTFVGWVTNIYDYAASKSQLGKYDTSLSGDAAQSVYMDATDDCLCVYAMWKKDGMSMCMCGDPTCTYIAGDLAHKGSHNAPTDGWIEVKHYEQLFYADDNYGYYLEDNIQDKKTIVTKTSTAVTYGEAWTTKTKTKVINLNGKNIDFYGNHGFFDGAELILSGTGTMKYNGSEAIKEDFIKTIPDIENNIEIYGAVTFDSFKMSGDANDARLIKAVNAAEGYGNIYIDGTIKMQNTSSASIVSKTGSIYIKGATFENTKDMDIKALGELYIDDVDFDGAEGLQIIAPENLMDIRNVNMTNIRPSSYGSRGTVTPDDATKDYSYDASIRDVVIKATRFSDAIYPTYTHPYSISSLSVANVDDISSIIEVAASERSASVAKFNIFNFNIGDDTHTTKGNGYDHIISTADYDETDGVEPMAIITIEKSKVYKTEDFGGFVASRAAKVVMKEVSIEQNTFKDDVVFEMAKMKAINLSLTKVDIKDNTTHDGILKLVAPIKDTGDYYNIEPNVLYDVNIVDNTIIGEGASTFYQPTGGERYAYEHYLYDGSSAESKMRNIEMVGTVNIHSNLYKADAASEGKEHNYYMELEADSQNNMNFKRGGVYLASNSKIAISVTSSMEASGLTEWVVANQSWGADIQKGVNTSVWQSDDPDYVVYRKTADNIMYGKKSAVSVIEVHYDYMDYEVTEDSKTAYQYIFSEDIPDMPQDPVRVDGAYFDQWYIDKEMTTPLVNASGQLQNLMGVDIGGAYPVATLYAVYKGDMLIVVEGNNGGTAFDGSTALSDTIPKRAIFKLQMGQKLSQAKRLKDDKLKDISHTLYGATNDYFDDGSNPNVARPLQDIINAVKPYYDETTYADYWEVVPVDLHNVSVTENTNLIFTKVGMKVSSFDDTNIDNTFYTKQGWNDGQPLSAGEWGDVVVWDDTRMDRDKFLYVYWAGETSRLRVHLHEATGSAPDSIRVVNAGIGEASGNVYNEGGQYFMKAKYNSRIEVLPDARRDGYSVKAWHKSDDIDASSTIEANVTPFMSDFTDVYVEWQPNNYDIIFSAPDADPNPTGMVSADGRVINATYSQTMTYDKTEKLMPIKYKKYGYRLDKWIYNDGVMDYEIDDEMEFNDTTNLHLAKSTQSIILKARWVKDDFKITYDLNDGYDGHSSQWSGSTKAHLPMIDEYSDEEMSSVSEAHIYGEPIGEVPIPTRKGYTFYGWWTNQGCTTVDGNQEVTSGMTYDWTKVGKTDSDGWLVATDSTLYAYWAPMVLNIEISGNDPEVSTGSMTTSFKGVFDGDAASNHMYFDQNTMEMLGHTYQYLEVEGTHATYSNISGAVQFNSDLTDIAHINLGLNNSDVEFASGSTIRVNAVWKEHRYKVHFVSNNPVNATTNPLQPVVEPEADGTKTVTREYGYREIVRPLNGFKFSDVTGKDETSEIENYDAALPTERQTIIDDYNATIIEMNGYVFDVWTDTADKAASTRKWDVWCATSSLIGHEPGDIGDNREITLYAQWIKNPYYIVFMQGDTEEDNSNPLYHPDYTNDSEISAYSEAGTLGILRDQKVSYGEPANLKDVHSTTDGDTGFHLAGHEFDYWVFERAETHEGDNITNTGAYIAEANITSGYPSTFSNTEEINDIVDVLNAKVYLRAIWKQNKYKVQYDANAPISPSGDANTVENMIPDRDITYRYDFNFSTEYPNPGTDLPRIKGYKFVGFYDDDGNTYNLTYGGDLTLQADSEWSDTLGFTKKRASESNAEIYVLHASWSNALAMLNFDANIEIDPDTLTTDDDVTGIPAEDTWFTYYDKPYGIHTTYKAPITASLPEPTRPGYDFMGWTRDPHAPSDIVADSDYVKNDTICRDYNETDPESEAEKLYAHWKNKNYKVKVYANKTIGLDGLEANGKIDGYVPATESYMHDVVYDDTFDITSLASSSMPGYIFLGYSRTSNVAAPEEAELINNDDEFISEYHRRYWAHDDDQVLNAQYKGIKYTLNFDLGNPEATGTLSPVTLTYDNEEVTDGSSDGGKYSLVEPTELIKLPGHTFDKWIYVDHPATKENPNTHIEATYSSADTVYNLTEEDGANITFKALWKEQEYNIEYIFVEPESPNASYHNYASTTSMPIQVLPYTATRSLTPNMYEVEGYEFDHWEEADESGTAITDARHFADGEDVSRLIAVSPDTGEIDPDNNTFYLVAKYKKKKYQVHLNIWDATKGYGTTNADFFYKEGSGAPVATNNVVIELTYDEEIGSSHPLVGGVAIKDTGYYGTRRGYDFLGWSLKSTLSYAEKETGAETIDSTYIHRSTDSTLEMYAVWKNHPVDIGFKVDTKTFPDYSQLMIGFYDAGGAEIGTTHGNSNLVAYDTVLDKTYRAYFDMPYGVASTNPDENVSNVRLLPAASNGVYTPGGWYHELIDDAHASPSIANKINENTICDIDIGDIENMMYMYWNGESYKLSLDPTGGWMYDVDAHPQAWTNDVKVINVMENTPINSYGNMPAYTDPKRNDAPEGPTSQHTIYKKGYNFNSWKTKEGDPDGYADVSGVPLPIDDSINYWRVGSATAYAIWDAKKYNIVYDENLPTTRQAGDVDWTAYGDLDADTIITYDTVVTPSTLKKPTMLGYKFDGWYTSTNVRLDATSSSTSYTWNYDHEFDGCDFMAYNETDDKYTVEVKAKWIPETYVITWDGNKGTIVDTTTPSVLDKEMSATSSITYDELITTAGYTDAMDDTKTYRKGYTLEGWYKTRGENPLEGTSTTYIQWHNTWQNPVSNATRFGKTPNVPDQEPEDQVYAALWLPKEITITFNGNKTSGSTDPDLSYMPNTTKKVYYDDLMSTSRTTGYLSGCGEHIAYTDTAFTPTRPGYDFLGWNTSSDGTGATISETTRINEAILTPGSIGSGDIPTTLTLYAQWKAKTYTVTLDPNDNTTIAGVRTQAHGTTAAVFATPTITVTFDEVLGSKLPSDSEMVRPGYIFKGWYTSDRYNNGAWNGTTGNKIEQTQIYSDRNDMAGNIGKVEFMDPTDPGALPIVFTAFWERKAVNIHLMGNKGDGSTDVTITGIHTDDVANGKYSYTNPGYFDLKVGHQNKNKRSGDVTDRTEVPTLKRMGYTFKGWSLASDSDVDLKTNDQLKNVEINNDMLTSGVLTENADGTTSDLTYYARWEAKQITVVFSDAVQSDTSYPASAFPSGMTKPYGSDGDMITYGHSTTGYYSGTGASQYAIWNGTALKVTFDKPLHISTAYSATKADFKSESEGSVRYGFELQSFNTKSTDAAGNVVVIEDGTMLDKAFVDSLQNKNIPEDQSMTTSYPDTFTLYPRWTQRKYSVTINANLPAAVAGTPGWDDITMNDIPFNEATTLDLSTWASPELNLDGYDFMGWGFDTSTVVYPPVIGQIQKIARMGCNNEDGTTSPAITLYAIWREGRMNITYRSKDRPAIIDLDVNTQLPKYIKMDGTLIDDTGAETDLPGEDNPPVIPGYTFLHWEWTDPQTGIVHISTPAVSATAHPFNGYESGTHNPIPKASESQLIFYAVWDAESYRVIYESNGAVQPSVIDNAAYNEPYTLHLPAGHTFTLPGYAIKYWSTDKRGLTGSQYSMGSQIVYTRESGITELHLWPIWTSATGETKAQSKGSRGGGGGGGGGGGKGGIQPNAKLPGVNQNLPTSGSGRFVTGNWLFNPGTAAWTFEIQSQALGIVDAKGNMTEQAQVGIIAANGWFEIPAGTGTAWYAFDVTGKMVTGFYQDPSNGAIYYCRTTPDERYGQMETGYQNIDGHTFYFNEYGTLMVNTITPDGRYAGPDGAIVSDLVSTQTVQEMAQGVKGILLANGYALSKDAGQNVLYIVDPATNQNLLAPEGWYTLLVNGKQQIYHINKYNLLDVGMLVDEQGYIYYLDSTEQNKGMMRTGSIKIGADEYYFQEKADGKTPYGALLKNGTLSDGRHTDSQGKIIK